MKHLRHLQRDGSNYIIRGDSHLMDFQLIIPKSPDECLKAIKKSIPYYYDMTNKMGNVYSYKLNNDKLLIMSRGVGYVPVTQKIV